MWTTLNSHAEWRLALALALCGFLACAGCVSTGSDATSRFPDSPRPAREVSDDRPPSVDRTQLTRPVVVHSVAATRVDAELARHAGAYFMKNAPEPLAIQVVVGEPIDPLERASSPAIVINGHVLSDTRVYGKQGTGLIAFLPDRKLIRDTNIVVVQWIGNEDATRSRELTFKASDIR